MTVRRAVQVFSLILFLFLLVAAASGSLYELPLDFFLRLDPFLVGGTALAGRTLTWAFLPALVVLVSALFLGRMFCGYVCPMGTTLDGMDRMVGRSKRRTGPPGESLRPIKYYVLWFMLGAAVLGVSFVLLASPLSLITRFYGLVVYPVIELILDFGVDLVRPVAGKANWTSLMFLQLHPPKFRTALFVFSLFAGIFAMGRLAPRFWCRYLCPAGALLALFSFRPLIRRAVSDEKCTQCGKCVRACPMDAIPLDEPILTRHAECVTCQTCQRVCPEDAIRFPFLPERSIPVSEKPAAGRRQFLAAGLAGLGTAAVGWSSLQTVTQSTGEGQVRPPGLIRPPGAKPEFEFLSLCVRCGECMAACPTNTIQPVWFSAGPLGIFSPALTPRRGFCDPRCNQCGQVCPTEAIRPIPLTDRPFAKTGTAVVRRERCLAWEHQKACVVCDEVCPFDAIDMAREPGNPATVPKVNEEKCVGCGYCEHFCPVQNRAAIEVVPFGEIRISQGSYQQEASGRGLQLMLQPEKGYPTPTYPSEAGETAPGFLPDDTGPAPGFTE
jgi:MauM/NapG family ferredoxin protein